VVPVTRPTRGSELFGCSVVHPIFYFPNNFLLHLWMALNGFVMESVDQCYVVQRYNGAESLISSLSRPLVSKPGTGSRYERDQTDESCDTYSQAEVAPSKNFPIDYRCEDSGHSGNAAGENAQDQVGAQPPFGLVALTYKTFPRSRNGRPARRFRSMISSGTPLVSGTKRKQKKRPANDRTE
jgi:hypothetical protein